MILVTGGSGFLGWNLLRTAPGSPALGATFYRHPMTRPGIRWVRMDFDDEGSIRNAIEDLRPSAVIHAAAMKDVDLCEKRPDQAECWNVHATETLCEACRKVGSRLIYVSTDLVFDGSKSFWTETDTASGPGVYARMKIRAEDIVLAGPGNAVVRVALLYGWSNGVNKSFIDWMWSRLGIARALPLFTDQFRTPILVEEAGSALLKLAAEEDLTGTFHLGGPERISRFEFGVKVCEHFPFDVRYLQPIRMKDAPGLLPRPADCSLDSRKMVNALNLTLSNVDEGLEKMARSYQLQ